MIDFTASWCGPCQLILPAINEFAEKYTDVDFIKIDVDELDVSSFFPIEITLTINVTSPLTDIDLIGDELCKQDVAQEFGVQAMPTFILMKKGKEIDKVVGAKKEDLQTKIEKHRF